MTQTRRPQIRRSIWLIVLSYLNRWYLYDLFLKTRIESALLDRSCHVPKWSIIAYYGRNKD